MDKQQYHEKAMSLLHDKNSYPTSTQRKSKYIYSIQL